MRTCKVCSVEKPLGEFPVYAVRVKTGHRRVCKLCWNAKWSGTVQKHNARYYHENKSGYRDRQKARTAARHPRESREHAARNARYSHRHPERAAAKQAVTLALRAGRLTRLPCQVCDAAKAQAHHDDYTRPLEVIWLCVDHHGERHRLLNRAVPPAKWPSEWPEDLRVREFP